MKQRFKLLLFASIGIFFLTGCGMLLAPTPLPASPTTAPTAAQAISLPTGTWTSTATKTIPPTPAATLPPAVTATPEIANGQIARKHIVELSETIGQRIAGTQSEEKAAQYIESVFKRLGYDVQRQPFSFDSGKGFTPNSTNIMAVKKGLSGREIVVGAHYDSVDIGKGADDNASGVAVMLEAAERVKDIQTPYSIRFIAFGAEEVDLDGSRSYVNNLSESDLQNTAGMINLDSLTSGDFSYVYGSAGKGQVMRDWILKKARVSGFKLETRPRSDLNEDDGSSCECADFVPFDDAKIPFAYFEATDWNLGDKDGYTQVSPEFGDEGAIWHTQYDDLEYLDRTFPGRVDGHLHLFVTLLFDTLTQFNFPS